MLQLYSECHASIDLWKLTYMKSCSKGLHQRHVIIAVQVAMFLKRIGGLAFFINMLGSSSEDC